jgi:hypothetical protein
MHNRFKHTGTIQVPDGPEWPYAFGPNQTAILCELEGWEFWEHEEKVLPALYAVSRFAALSAGGNATPEELQQAAQDSRKCLFNNPRFVQHFYYSAIRFGHELAGLPVDFTPAEVGMYWQQTPTAFLPAFTHYMQQQADRAGVAEARPTAAPRAGEVKKPAKKKLKAA